MGYDQAAERSAVHDNNEAGTADKGLPAVRLGRRLGQRMHLRDHDGFGDGRGDKNAEFFVWHPFQIQRGHSPFLSILEQSFCIPTEHVPAGKGPAASFDPHGRHAGKKFLLWYWQPPLLAFVLQKSDFL